MYQYLRTPVILLCLLLITVSLNVKAQSASEALKPILQNLLSYKATFVQVIEDAEGQIIQQSEGNIMLKKPHQLRWEVTLPDESLFVADGDAVYSIDPFVEQVTILEQNEVINNNPLMLLISDDQEAWNNVDISIQNNEYWLSSKDPNATIVLLKLRFDNGVMTSLTSVDRQQQSNVIAFSDIQQNIILAESVFTVEIPASFVIDDQRQKIAVP